MAIYKIADLLIDIKNKYAYTTVLCRNYLHDDQSAIPDFSVEANTNDYAKDKAYLVDASDPYLETLSIYRQIARRILDYKGMVMHASVVEMDGKAYAFAAKSGTGKSTHSRLWLDVFGEKARIINGDKPLIRLLDDVLYVYGTPWCGKEGYNFNAKAPLSNICFIERSDTNYIEPLDKNSAVKKIFDQLLLPENALQANLFLDMVEILIDKASFYVLHCNMDKEAAKVAYEGMNSEQ